LIHRVISCKVTFALIFYRSWITSDNTVMLLRTPLMDQMGYRLITAEMLKAGSIG